MKLFISSYYSDYVYNRLDWLLSSHLSLSKLVEINFLELARGIHNDKTAIKFFQKSLNCS